MNAAFLNEVMLESLAQDDLQGFESDFASDQSDAGQYEWRSEGAFDDAPGSYEADDAFNDGEYDDQESGDQYYDREWSQDDYGSGGLTEPEVYELASSLMALETPAEAEEFLGSIFKKARRGLAKFARPLLAKVAPLVGAGLGSMVPGVGTALGGMAGNALGSMIGGGAGRGAGGGGLPANLSSALSQFIGKGGNPLAAILQSGLGQGLLGKLLGGQMEMASDSEAQFELAKRTVRALDSMAQEMAGIDEGQYEFDRRGSEAMLRAIREHLPPGIRPALIDTSRG